MVKGLGFRVLGLGFRFQGLGLRFRGLVFRGRILSRCPWSLYGLRCFRGLRADVCRRGVGSSGARDSEFGGPVEFAKP